MTLNVRHNVGLHNQKIVEKYVVIQINEKVYGEA